MPKRQPRPRRRAPLAPALPPSPPPVNALLAQLRARQEDPLGLLALVAPYRPEQLDPIAQDCLDGYLPGWRDALQWGWASCAACGERASQALRRARGDALRNIDKAPVLGGSLVMPLSDASQRGFGAFQGHGPRDWLLRPQDVWAQVDDSGCCGAMGTPGNTRCGHCGATLGTSFTDCYGAHWAALYADAVTLRWGVAPLTAPEHALAARLGDLAQDDLAHAHRVARTLPADLSPQLYAALVQRLGHFGDAHVQRDAEDASTCAEWLRNWQHNGRSAHASLNDRSRGVTFYHLPDNGHAYQHGPSLNVSTGDAQRAARLAWHHRDTVCGVWELPEPAADAAEALLQGPLRRRDWEALLGDLPRPPGLQTRALRASLKAFPWLDPAPA